MKIKNNNLKVNLNFFNNSPNKLYSIFVLDNDNEVPLKEHLFKVRNEGNAIIELELKLAKAKEHNLIVVIIGSHGTVSGYPSEDILTTNKITLFE